jgi:hypothetical protein
MCLKNYPQCIDCGAIGKNFVQHHCGMCHTRRRFRLCTLKCNSATSPLDLQDVGLVNAAVTDSNVAQANAFTARMQTAHKNSGGQSLGTISSTPSVPLTTNTLNTIRSNASSGRMITVCASPCLTKGAFHQLRDLSRAFSADKMMDRAFLFTFSIVLC